MSTTAKPKQHRELPPFEWTLNSCFEGDECSMLYRDERFKAQMEIHTPRLENGEMGKGKTFFFLDEDKRTFKTQEELREAILNGPRELWVYAGTTRGRPDDE